ncbi:uncharacterized protein LOC142355160 [Convolutriloba macropyga]|uniref:uncharacterized protein LOC142355160 n=1 Tax=Convolutriloba macropyga TaxID=536237 RepID=UPI003F526EDF
MMLQTRGIASNDVKEASKQVAANLARFSSMGKLETEGPGNQFVSATHGHMTVNNGRHNAVYRLVNTVYVIGIAAPSTALFSLVRLVDGATKQLVVACRGTDVTVDKVAKNYAAVYAGTSAALDTLGTNPTQADVVSANMLTLMFPEDSKKDKKNKKKADQSVDAAAVGSKPRGNWHGQRRSLVDGPKLGDATVDKQAGIPPSPARSSIYRTPKSSPKGSRISTPDWRGFNGATTAPSSSRPSQNGDNEWDQLSAFPPPTLCADVPSSPPVPTGVATDQDPQRSFETTLRNSSLVDESEFFQIAPDSSSAPGFANFGAPAPPVVDHDEFPSMHALGDATHGFSNSATTTDMLPAQSFKHEDAPFGTAAGFAEFGWGGPDAANTLPSTDVAQAKDFGALPASPDSDQNRDSYAGQASITVEAFAQPSIASVTPAAASDFLRHPLPVNTSPSMLQLVEVWEAEFQGDMLMSSSISGEVQMTAGMVAQTLPAFTIQARIAESHPVYPLLQKSLLAAEMKDGAGCLDTKPGSYRAEFDAGDELEHPQALLRYQLPPSSVPPPMVVKVSIGALSGSLPGGPELVSVMYAVSPMLCGPLEDVFVQVELGSKNLVPVKARPHAEWCPARGIVQWHIGSLTPEAAGACHLQVGSVDSPEDSIRGHHLPSGLVSRACARFTCSTGSFSGAACLHAESSYDVHKPGQQLLPPSVLVTGLVTAKPALPAR